VNDILAAPMSWLFRLRGILDPAQAVPGLGASMSEALALGELAAAGPAVPAGTGASALSASALSAAPGPSAFSAAPGITQQDLGTRLGLEKSTVSRLVDAMAGKGWVERVPDPANRRFRNVRLTPAGHEAAAQVAAAIRQRHDRILGSLTPEERDALVVAINALSRAMREEFGVG
jgi:DNA-binding MarR family transcriptional regulator